MHDLDYITVLKAIREIPFNVGKKLLINFLQGNAHESIERNRLDRLDHYGSLAYTSAELTAMIDNLIMNNMISLTSFSSNKFAKVMELSSKGKEEIDNPTLHKKKLSFKTEPTVITEKDKEIMESLGSILDRFNDEQKKAIICTSPHILCIAGAGSGKTTVLTERIKFLMTYRSVEPHKILAITFTRKARREMMRRLPDSSVHIQTFNSFCETILRKHAIEIYGKHMNVISYKDKIVMLKKALSALDLAMHKVISTYFSIAQRRGKTDEELARIFMNDCFFVLDYFKFKNQPIPDINDEAAKIVFSVCNFLDAYMKKNGLRDFADQLIDTIRFFEEKGQIPQYDHILVDEFQDVNSTQIKLLDLLNSPNLFCVGDPRQSIFGWRGSDIRYILGFEEKYPDSEIITLTKNYRSSKPIVNLINESIKTLGLPDIESTLQGEKDIHLMKMPSETAEFEFIADQILKSPLPRSEIFVLARTNRQLTSLSQLLRQKRISHIVRSDELKRTVLAGKDDVTLATIHSIKGMEAELVFVMGCTSQNFPCKGSEHPVIEMIKIDEYDKEEEERRLFYVAMSRAKNKLYMTYSTRSHTYFITPEMLALMEPDKKVDKKPVKFQPTASNDTLTNLKDWRRNLSSELGIPPYCIMHDKTLIEIITQKPSSLRDLEDINGMGPIKIMKYGEQILDIVNS